MSQTELLDEAIADYLGWNWRSKAGLPIVNVPGCPVQPDNFMETVLYLLYQAAGMAPIIPLDDQLRPTWLFGKTVHEGCDRAGYYEQADFAHEYGSPKCLVKIGCWGPVVNCNVTKRGWMRGIASPRRRRSWHGGCARSNPMRAKPAPWHARRRKPCATRKAAWRSPSLGTRSARSASTTSAVLA